MPRAPPSTQITNTTCRILNILSKKAQPIPILFSQVTHLEAMGTPDSKTQTFPWNVKRRCPIWIYLMTRLRSLHNNTLAEFGKEKIISKCNSLWVLCYLQNFFFQYSVDTVSLVNVLAGTDPSSSSTWGPVWNQQRRKDSEHKEMLWTQLCHAAEFHAVTPCDKANFKLKALQLHSEFCTKASELHVVGLVHTRS